MTVPSRGWMGLDMLIIIKPCQTQLKLTNWHEWSQRQKWLSQVPWMQVISSPIILCERLQRAVTLDRVTYLQLSAPHNAKECQHPVHQYCCLHLFMALHTMLLTLGDFYQSVNSHPVYLPYTTIQTFGHTFSFNNYFLLDYENTK